MSNRPPGGFSAHTRPSRIAGMERNMSVMTPAELMNAALDGNLDLDAGGDQEQKTTGDEQQEAAKQPEKTEPAPAQGDKPAGEQAGAEAEVPGTPIASKSGTYQLPYEKLVEAREKSKLLEAENAQLRAQNAELTTRQQANLAEQQAAAEKRAAQGQSATKADENLEAAQKAIDSGKVDVSLFGDFSEEALAAGIEKLVEQRVAQRLAPIQQEIAPLKQKAVQTAEDTHYAAIIQAHPDASELMESTEFAAWKAGLPSFMRQGVEHSLKDGSTRDVIDVFSTFKQASGKAPAAAGAPAAAPGKAAPEVQRHVPNSLSEIAGDAASDPNGVVMSKAGNPAALLDHFTGMSRQQIDDALDRVV